MVITNTYNINYGWTIRVNMIVNDVEGGIHYIESIRAKKNNKEIIILEDYYFNANHPVIFAEATNKNSFVIRIAEKGEIYDYLVRVKVCNDIIYLSYEDFLGSYPLEED